MYVQVWRVLHRVWSVSREEAAWEDGHVHMCFNKHVRTCALHRVGRMVGCCPGKQVLNHNVTICTGDHWCFSRWLIIDSNYDFFLFYLAEYQYTFWQTALLWFECQVILWTFSKIGWYIGILLNVCHESLMLAIALLFLNISLSNIQTIFLIKIRTFVTSYLRATHDCV